MNQLVAQFGRHAAEGDLLASDETVDSQSGSPRPNSALSSKSELAQAGPRPSLLVV